MTEKNLVSKLRRGDKASFDELFNRYFEQCFTYAVSLLKDPDAAEDVVQNVFLKLWSGRERLDSSRQFRSYLLTSVRNESISWLRAKFVADRERRPVQEPVDETQNILNSISALELDASISAAVSRLSEKRRTSREAQVRWKDACNFINTKTIENVFFTAYRTAAAAADADAPGRSGQGRGEHSSL